jgi:hypothetical protein
VAGGYQSLGGHMAEKPSDPITGISWPGTCCKYELRRAFQWHLHVYVGHLTVKPLRPFVYPNWKCFHKSWNFIAYNTCILRRDHNAHINNVQRERICCKV